VENPIATVLFDLLLAGTVFAVLGREISAPVRRAALRAGAALARRERLPHRASLGPARSGPFA